MGSEGENENQSKGGTRIRFAGRVNRSIPAITSLQEAYVRKVIDAVNDLDNVLYEICNEGDLTSVPW